MGSVEPIAVKAFRHQSECLFTRGKQNVTVEYKGNNFSLCKQGQTEHEKGGLLSMNVEIMPEHWFHMQYSCHAQHELKMSCWCKEVPRCTLCAGIFILRFFQELQIMETHLQHISKQTSTYSTPLSTKSSK